MRLPISLAALAAVFLGCTALSQTGRAGSTTQVPPPAFSPSIEVSGIQTAVLAGGCFWGVQAVFQHVKGVTLAQSGYTGGTTTAPGCDEVSTGHTGHAESIKIAYDPKQISYGQLLQIFFSVVQDPTELDAQGPDEGTQYRSDIFAATPEQREEAKTYITQLDQAHVFANPIVTRVDALGPFFPAESYHQDFALRHPDHPYIVMNDAPKVTELKRRFPALYRESPRVSRQPRWEVRVG